jgi:ribonuclease-3
MKEFHKFKETVGLSGQETPTLAEAFTHRSYAVENNLEFDNQRLEFLGDAVLEIILTEYLFKLYPGMNEGDMTKIRSALVREKTLAELAIMLDLGDFLRIGKGEQENGGASRQSTLADLFEAVLGAIYLDAGFDFARDFILDLYSRHTPEPESLLLSINPKGTLQEFAQKCRFQPPVYRVLHILGPEHNPTYEVEVTCNGCSAAGAGVSRKQAEGAAAKKLYEYLCQTVSPENA